MSAHTPGPWEWAGNTLRPVNADPHRGAVHSILDAEGGFGFLDSKPSDTLRELDADRMLIAAAPELLEALQAEEEWRAREEDGAIDPEWDYEVMVAAKRRAAIDKATGGAA